ncbi:Nin one binding Zn-ribbon like-domain-containing protein [Blastocladiella britannica]|nr:Nin one binding Zn-ribbon like-domain-containing protein [Blastocladiella britannica]
MAPTKKARILVLDTAPFIKQVPLYHLADRFVSLADVVGEVRDPAARAAMARLPFKVETKAPSEAAMAAVASFAKKTGDFPALSVTDMRVLAVVWMLTMEEDGIDAIRTELAQPAEQKKKRSGRRGKGRLMTDEEFGEAMTAASADADVDAADAADAEEDEVVPTLDADPFAPRAEAADTDLEAQLRELELEDAEEQVPEPTPASAAPSGTDGGASSLSNLQFKQLPGFVEADSDNEEDEEAGWITPDNVEEAKEVTINGSRRAGDTQIPSVACMTDDFAMQNVLLQMGLHLLSLDGVHVRQLKNWILRCHGCFNTTSDMERRFCPSCGGNTLIRTSYTIENGIMRVHLKKNFQYRTRGTVFSLPSPKTGRGADNLILREDQHEYQVRTKSYQHQKKKQEKKMWDERVFGDAPVRPPTIGFGSRNPNEKVTMRK